MVKASGRRVMNMKRENTFFLKISLVLFGLMACLEPQTVSAGICGEPVLQLGWFTTTQGKSQHIDIEGLIGDEFKVKKTTGQNFLVGAGYYFRGFDIAKTDPCCGVNASFLYGINAFYLLPTKVHGLVVQENLFTNLSYRYSRENYPIYLAAKALVNIFDCHDFTIDLGIGPNIIRTSGFKEKSLDGITLPDHIFSGKTTVAFSATAGLGWRIHHLLETFSLEIDYRFFYLGQGKLKKANSQVKNTLRTGNSYGNALFLSISI